MRSFAGTLEVVIRALGLLLATMAVAAMSCSTSEPEPVAWPDLGPAWPEESWQPVYLDLSTLDPSPDAVLDHDGAGSTLDEVRVRDALVDGSAIEHHYPQARIFPAYDQSSAGVRVVYMVGEDEFLLQEDHVMGHYDHFIGPFRGDPRRVLAGLAS